MTNEKELVALKYDGNDAPTVAQRATGSIAEEILKLAEEQGLYIHQDAELLARLEELQDGDPIPPALYVVIAEILAYAFFLQGKTPEHWKRPDGTIGIDLKT